MHEYSQPLGDAVRRARREKELTQRQVAELIDVDERTIMNIEKYCSNTTMAVLYPLLRTLQIDSREIFNPEMGRESASHHQLMVLIASCSEDEAHTLFLVCQAVISALHSQDAITIDKK